MISNIISPPVLAQAKALKRYAMTTLAILLGLLTSSTVTVEEALVG